MKKKIFGIIYLLIDGTNDFEYVGQTTRSLEVRFKQHAKNKKHTYISNAIQSHGEDMFVKVILKVCYSKEELNYWERHFIKSRDTIAPNGYNLTEGGEGIIGLKKTPAIVAKVAATHRVETPYKNLLSVITERKCSYSDLDRLLGLSQAAFSHRMRGKTNFKEQEILKLVEIFNKPAEYLLQRDDGLTETTFEAKMHVRLSAVRYKSSPFKNLICEMDRHKFSCKLLARLLELDASNISRKIHGKIRFTEKDTAKLVEIFDKPADYLMAREGELPKVKSKAEKCAKISAAHRQDTPFKNLLCEIDKQQLTYTALAKLLGLSGGDISYKMRGKVHFTEQDIAKLVEIFEKPANYLMARDDTE